MRLLLLLALIFLPLTAGAQTPCTPNNNSIFTINGNTLATTTPQPVGNYVAGVVVTVPGAANSPLCIGVPVFGQSPGAPTISVNGSSSGITVNPGALVTVAVTNGPGNATDLMALCLTNTSCDINNPADYSDYDYLNCGKNVPSPSGATTTATCGLAAPKTPGNYFADFLTSATNVIASAPFTVGGGGGTCTGNDGTVLPTPPAGYCWSLTFADNFLAPSANTGTADVPVEINTSVWDYTSWCGSPDPGRGSPYYECKLYNTPGYNLGVVIPNGGPLTYEQDPNTGVIYIMNTNGDYNFGPPSFSQRYGYFVYNAQLPNPSPQQNSVSSFLEFDLEGFAKGGFCTNGCTPPAEYGELGFVRNGNGCVGGYNYTTTCWFELAGHNTTWFEPLSINTDLTAGFNQFGIRWTNDSSAHGSVTAYFNGAAVSATRQLASSGWDNGLYFDIWDSGQASSGQTPMKMKWVRAYCLVPVGGGGCVAL